MHSEAKLILPDHHFKIPFTPLALAGVTQLVEHHSAKQKVAGLIPSQGTSLGCRFHSQLERVHARDNQLMFFSRINVSLALFLFSLPYLS